ncbi:hypothetical protein O1611_g9651 [Lasiodiplodia mahajangana]|uniref:Uncharacterized protein n=1 Tax=Lasiodiplodia mahajangana TaxID=1108764 RepID=A0ACC2J772_9PEZI|nr:hypothetical protein O1611_g9651 [Lasiodiplodia mahajangana]
MTTKQANELIALGVPKLTFDYGGAYRPSVQRVLIAAKAGAAAIYVDLLKKQRHWVGFADVTPKKARNYKENRLTQAPDPETIGEANTLREYWEAVLDRYPIQAGADPKSDQSARKRLPGSPTV